jgi:hypothetical protein
MVFAISTPTNACVKRGILFINKSFYGIDCSKKSCLDNCGGLERGICVTGECHCKNGYTGASCEFKACPNSCSNNGKCFKGECQCEPGFTGKDCSLPECPNMCSNKGICTGAPFFKCVCEEGLFYL